MRKVSQFFWKSCFAAAIIAGAVVTFLIIHLEANLPPVDMLKDVQLQIPLKIYSADGKLIAEYGDKRRTPLQLAQVPQLLKDAIIATEDHRFYRHPGVDIRGLLRAVVNLISKRNKEQGGSTITMQVARNFFLTSKKTYTRKLNEILLALKIEQELSKDEILELYLNKIYFGKRAYGVAAAAEVYYGTTVDKLNLAQIAMLAGLPQAPSTINPLHSPENALKRRTHVLERMRAYNMISVEEFATAMNEPITTVYHGRQVELPAPYVAEMVRQCLIEMYGEDAYDRGYQVTTTINSSQQIAANNALTRAVLEYDQRHGYRGPIKKVNPRSNVQAELRDIPRINMLIPAVVTEVRNTNAVVLPKDGGKINISLENMLWAHGGATSATEILHEGDIIYIAPQANNRWVLAQVPQIEGAFVSMDPNDGAITALVGGFDYEKSSFNRAAQAFRQTGSSFKPLIYTAALENNFTAASILNDAPVVQDDQTDEEWRPQNHTKEFYGPTRLRVALTYSRNLVSIRLLQALGINKAIETLGKIGLNTRNLPRGLSMALGTYNMSPIEVAAAYSVFPNGGYKIDSHFIKQIKDTQNNVIYTANPPVPGSAELPAPSVITPQTAYIITTMLQDVIKHGSGRKALQLGRNDLAGKTGTTNDQMDGWFAGFNRNLVAVSWIGFDEPKSLKEYASASSLPMWVYFMDKALRGKLDQMPTQPPGLVTVRIDPATGLLAIDGQNDAIYEIFTEETAPKTVATTAAVTNPEHGAITNQLLEADNLF